MTAWWRRNEGTRIDRAVVLVLLTRLSLLLAAPVTLWLVAAKRPVAEQGLFFILWNIQALTQLMELGIQTLIVQFASHESHSLTWNARGGLDGDAGAKARVHQAIREGRRWYGRVAIALGILAASGGIWIIAVRANEVGRAALVPWLVTVAFTAAYLPIVPVLCAIEGCGGLLRVQRMRLVQTVLSIFALWTMLLWLGALWGVAAFAVTWFLTAWGWLLRSHSQLLSDALEARLTDLAGADASASLAAVQWRTGATWLAWWIAPQCVTPIVLTTHGALPGGQVGMSFAIATAPLTLGIVWLQARYPRYAALLAKGEGEQLRRLARRATIQAAAVCTSGVLAVALAVWVIGRLSPSLASRALPARWIVVLGLTNLAWLLVQSLSSYLRAWRQEPLMETAIVGAIVVMAGTSAVALHVPTESIIAAYALLIAGAVVPLAVLQFRRRHEHLVRSGAEVSNSVV